MVNIDKTETQILRDEHKLPQCLKFTFKDLSELSPPLPVKTVVEGGCCPAADGNL